MVNKQHILHKLKEMKPELSDKYAVEQIGVFGSFAEDKANEESDIDILVELKEPIGWKFFSLEIYLEKIFGRKVDLTTKKALKKQLKKDILNKVKYV